MTAAAEQLYQRQGWRLSGSKPSYALLPAGGLCTTRYYYRELGR